MIRVVSFDIDDTLYDFTTLSRKALAEVARRLRERVGARAAEVTEEMIIRDLEATAQEMAHPYARLNDFRRKCFGITLGRCGVVDAELVEELNRTYRRHRFLPTTPYDGVRATLERLARSYVLCGLSNGEQNLEELGLADLLQFSITAEEAGVQKPDPRIFQAAMKRAGCVPRELAHVGDALHSDVAGARAAGAWAVWFNPGGLPPDPDIIPDAECARFADLPGVLQELDRPERRARGPAAVRNAPT